MMLTAKGLEHQGQICIDDFPQFKSNAHFLSNYALTLAGHGTELTLHFPINY